MRVSSCQLPEEEVIWRFVIWHSPSGICHCPASSRSHGLSTDLESSVESLDHPVDNAPVRSLQHKGMTVEGYSRAAVQTYWRGAPPKVGFVPRGQPRSFLGTPHRVFSPPPPPPTTPPPALGARRGRMK